MQSFRRFITSQCKQRGSQILINRQCSSAVVPLSEFVEKGNFIFSQEQKRQLEEVGRVEKVPICVSGPPENVVLMMNENISTPYDCCRHISEALCNQSPLAVINENILWDMHRPLPGECQLRFLNFRDKEPHSLNEAFWRTGSLILGAVIMKAFKEEAGVGLWSFPEVKLNSGSFIYDAYMKLPNWKPTTDELKVLSGELLTFARQNHKIERLDVKKSIAAEIFEGNPNKLSDIKKMAAQSEDHLVTLYRVGDHIDVSTGPMVGNTLFFGRCTVCAVHSLYEYTGFPLYRFQGVGLPKGIMLNSFAYSVLQVRAQRLNEINIDGLKENQQPYGKPYTRPRNSESEASPKPEFMEPLLPFK